MDFHKAVKSECARQGITLSELASRIGMNRKTLYSVCSGLPTLRTASSIAACLGMKTSQLVAIAEDCA